MKTRLVILLLCGLMTILSGCDFTLSADPRDLMQVPKLSGDKEDLRSLINAYISEQKAEIIRPLKMEDTSAINFVDMNNDGVSEAVLFYRTKDQSQIYGMIWGVINKKWTVIKEFPGEGQALDTLYIANITNDDNKEIIAGYSSGDPDAQKGLIVYEFKNSQMQNLLKKSYTNYVINDLNGDGRKEIVLLNFKPGQVAELVAIQYDDALKKFVTLSSVPLDYYASFFNLITGRVHDRTQGIVLDVSVGAHSAYTEVIVMKDNKLVSVVPKISTMKPYMTLSSDENKDGIIEIALREVPYGWDDTAIAVIPYLISYQQWDGEHGLNFVMEQYRDPQDLFYVNFPAAWHHKVTITRDSELERYIHFVSIETGETMAEIRFFSPAEWEKRDEGYRLLARTHDEIIGLRSKVDLEAGRGSKVLTLPSTE